MTDAGDSTSVSFNPFDTAGEASGEFVFTVSIVFEASIMLSYAALEAAENPVSGMESEFKKPGVVPGNGRSVRAYRVHRALPSNTDHGQALYHPWRGALPRKGF
jgi:hypothetical protein